MTILVKLESNVITISWLNTTYSRKNGAIGAEFNITRLIKC